LHAPSAHLQSAPHLQASPHLQAAALQAFGHLHAPSTHLQSAPHLQASPHLHFVHAASAAHAGPMPDQANPNASKTTETTTRLLILIFIILVVCRAALFHRDPLGSPERQREHSLPLKQS